MVKEAVNALAVSDSLNGMTNSKTRVCPGAKVRSAVPERKVGLNCRLLGVEAVEFRFDCSSVSETLLASVPSRQTSGSSPSVLWRMVIGFKEVSKSTVTSSMTTGTEPSDACEVTLS